MINFIVKSRAAEERKNIRLASLFVSMALGHKITSILIVPLLFLMLLQINRWKVDRTFIIEKTKYFFLPMGLLSLFFANPSLLVSPFVPKYFIKYFGTLEAFSTFTISSPKVINHDLVYMFINGISSKFIHLYGVLIIATMFSFLLYKKYRNNVRDIIQNQPLLISMYSSVMVIIVLLMVKRDPIIISNYYLAFGFLFLLIFLSVLVKTKKLKYIIPLSVLLINIVFNYHNIYISYNNLYYRQNAIQNSLALLTQMQKLIKYNEEEKLNIIASVSLLMPYQNIRSNVKAVNIFDNINITMNWINEEFHYIILDKNSLIMQPVDKIYQKRNVVHLKRFKEFVTSYYIIEKLRIDQKFKNSSYNIFYEDKDCLIYKKVEF